MPAIRYAVVYSPPEQVKPYMPHNYRTVVGLGADATLIAGQDVEGWTLDGYVLPRLASGLHRCREVSRMTALGFVELAGGNPADLAVG